MTTPTPKPGPPLPYLQGGPSTAITVKSESYYPRSPVSVAITVRGANAETTAAELTNATNLALLQLHAMSTAEAGKGSK